MSSDNWRRDLEDDEAVLPPPSQEWQDAHGWRDGEAPPGGNGSERRNTADDQAAPALRLRYGFDATAAQPWEPSSRGAARWQRVAVLRAAKIRQEFFGH